MREQPKQFPAESERLSFRCWAPSDSALALELWGNASVTRFICAAPWTPDEIAQKLESEISTQRNAGVSYWPAFHKSTGAFVGCGGLRPYGDEESTREFGVQLLPSRWGNGYATELGRAVLRHAFNELQLEALFAGHHPENLASRRMLEKLGFSWTHDELYEPTGREHPSYLLTRKDWCQTP